MFSTGFCTVPFLLSFRHILLVGSWLRWGHPFSVAWSADSAVSCCTVDGFGHFLLLPGLRTQPFTVAQSPDLRMHVAAPLDLWDTVNGVLRVADHTSFNWSTPQPQTPTRRSVALLDHWTSGTRVAVLISAHYCGDASGDRFGNLPPVPSAIFLTSTARA